jgi:hypothetical protein
MRLVSNTYEIEFKASRWNESGAKIENAVFVLQDHANAVRFRTIWAKVPRY